VPPEFRAEWERDSGYPEEILEKEEMTFEPAIKR
jgi:hypothetical protein